MGLYGFDLGYELQQRHVYEDHHNVVGQVDSSLTSLFTTLMYLASCTNDTPKNLSVAWACRCKPTAVLIFSLYLALFHDHMHTHMEANWKVLGRSTSTAHRAGNAGPA